MINWIKPTGEGPHERPRITANHLGLDLPGTLRESYPWGPKQYGWWACYYDKGRFAETFREACRDAAYLGQGRTTR